MKSIKEKHILTDCDGVLVNWASEFSNFMTNHGYPQLPNSESSYDICDRHGVSYGEAKSFIKSFNESPHIAKLPAYADSQKFVGKLVNLGFRFTVITSLSSNTLASDYRNQNLKSLFGDIFDEIRCLNQGENKLNELTRWKNSKLFWIEDSFEQAEAGHTAGLNSVLIKHPYSSKHESLPFTHVNHVTPWEEIYSIICKEYNL